MKPRMISRTSYVGRPITLKFAYQIWMAIVFLSLGRFDPDFAPLTAAGLTANQIGFYGLAVLLAALAVADRSYRILKSPFGACILALSLWSITSSIWSVSSFVSLQKAISYSIVLVASSYFVQKITSEQLLHGALVSTVAALLISTCLAILLPQTAGTTPFHEDAWRGIFMQKNVLGRAAMVAGIIAIALIKTSTTTKYRMLVLFAIILSTLILYQTRSLTAIFALIIFSFSFPAALWLRSASAPIRLLIFGVLVSSAPIVYLAIGPTLAFLGELTGISADLTGRIPLWLFVVDRTLEQPLIGLGIEGLFGPSIEADLLLSLGWIPDHAHNGLLDLWAELGFVGLFLFLMSFLAFTLSIPRARPWVSEDTIFMVRFSVLIVLMLILMNVTESNLYRSSNTFWLMYLVVGLKLQITQQNQRAAVTRQHSGRRSSFIRKYDASLGFAGRKYPE